MINAVIFDMDGVLSDSEWIYVEKILEVLREEGVFIEAWFRDWFEAVDTG